LKNKGHFEIFVQLLDLTLLLLMGVPPAYFRHQNSGTAKDQAMRFCDFSKILCLGYKILCLSAAQHVPKIQYGGAETGSMQAV